MLHHGECLLSQCAGGICAVCRGRVPVGAAVQISSRSNEIRHVECDGSSASGDRRDEHLGDNITICAGSGYQGLIKSIHRPVSRRRKPKSEDS